MKTGSKGLQLIKSFEGFRSNAYICPAGVLTIGYGTTKGVKKGMVINESQAEQLLKRDVEVFESVINKNVKVPLTQNQFDALVSFVYNVGPGSFLKSTLLVLLNQKKYNEIPAQLMRWNKGGGRVLPGLTKRRKAEGDLFTL